MIASGGRWRGVWAGSGRFLEGWGHEAAMGTCALRDGGERPASGLAHWWGLGVFLLKATRSHHHRASLVLYSPVEPVGLTIHIQP